MAHLLEVGLYNLGGWIYTGKITKIFVNRRKQQVEGSKKDVKNRR